MKVIKIETNKEKNKYYEISKVKTKKYNSSIEKKVVNIYPDVTYQKFYGFGGAITEASAYAYSILPDEKKKQFMQDYFGDLNYSLCRLTIGSCDFSLSYYCYAKKKDLSDFSMEHDEKYIIPFIKDAMKVNPNLRFLATPWSPPRFMKNTKMSCFGGKLLKKYRQTYSEYLAKYILAYENQGIHIDYITVQNEANAKQYWESCIFKPEAEADFLVNYLFPTFEKNNIKTKILIYDHNKENLFNRANEEFSNPEVLKAAGGVAFHWYSGSHFENIALCREKYPDKLLIHTEGCFGYTPNKSYADDYATDIAEDLNAGANGYIDWNILLNSKGGPCHKKNNCNSPVMLLPDASDYNKTTAFYYIGHFSKVIKPDAVRIAHSKYLSDIRMTAFKNPDGSIAVVMLNREHYDISFRICIGDKTFKDTLFHKSMISYIIK